MKESNAVTSAKTKQITPEVLEEAIEWLETETYCCYALASALSGYEFESYSTKDKHIKLAEDFLHPLLVRDNITNSGKWVNLYNSKHLQFTRSEWLRKIAQELREGKISA